MRPESPPSDRLNTVLAAGAFLVGCLRAWSLPSATESTFQLVRAGNGFLREGPGFYGQPPGGEGAPLLGALVTAAGALFAPGVETLGLPAGSVLLGACAALLAGTLARSAGPAIAVLGVTFLVVPPAFASSFPAHPDAALGGLLLTAAFASRLTRKSPSRFLAYVSLAALATPVAWPVATWRQATLGPVERRRPRMWIATGATLSLVGVLTLGLPPGSRGEILVGLLGDWSVSAEGWISTLGTVRHVWAGGALLLLPPLLAWRSRGRAGRELLGPWGWAVGTAIALSGPGHFGEATAALVPPTCLLGALLVSGLPDRDRREGPSGPARPVLLALLVPILLLVLQSERDRERRADTDEASARDAQIVEFLDARFRFPGAILSERTGVLAALTTRAVHPLPRGGTIPARGDTSGLPRVVVFRNGIRPESRSEVALFSRPEFLSHYAPLAFRRGATRSIPDVVWVLRPGPAEIDSVPAGYAEALREGWQRHATESFPEARKAFQVAAARESPGLGIAHEWLGILEELLGNPEAAEMLFHEARHRDPTTAQARGHLADRALSRNRIAQADSLLAEAFRYTEHDARLWGTRARLVHRTGDARAALVDSRQAMRLDPRDARILANHGILLWEVGERGAARDFWDAAVLRDRRILRYLGNYREAEEDAPPPPLLPLFSLQGFAPDPGKRPGRSGAEDRK